MALKKWAYIFLSPGFDPKEHSISLRSEQTEVRIVGIEMTKKEMVTTIAQDLVEEGVQMIELCGGFGPIWVARVTEAIAGAVPVGSVAYGPESRIPLLEILGQSQKPEATI
jgi:Family of unknown function (DUF6506)